MLSLNSRRLDLSAVLLLALALVTLIACRTAPARVAAEPVVVSIFDTSTGDGEYMQKQLQARFTRETGIAVKSLVASERSNSMRSEQLDLMQSGSIAPDIYLLDNVWASNFVDYLVDLSPAVTPQERAAFIPEVLKAYLVNGRMVAIPLENGFPLLYYRTDLLARYGFKKPPETWDELELMARAIQTGERRLGNENFWGYVWEGAANETLTCVAQEYQVSSGGGHMLEENHTISVNNARAAHTFARAARWINWISPPGTSAYFEEDARNVWEAGNAAFARNWADNYALDQAEGSRLRNKFAATVLPHDPGARSASTVGGWGNGVSRRSPHPREAIQLVRFLTSRADQGWRFEHYSQLPAITGLYSDPAMRSAAAFLRPYEGQLLASAVARPSALAKNQYQQVSAAYAQSIHSILVHRQTAPEALADLETRLVELTGFKPGPPQ